MDIRKVKKLMEMLEESSLGEMEIIEGEESIRLSKSSSSVAPVQNTQILYRKILVLQKSKKILAKMKQYKKMKLLKIYLAMK